MAVQRHEPAAGEPVKVAIPSVEARTETEALQVLYDAKLRPQIKRVQHDTIAKGTAIGTVPAGGIVAGTWIRK